MVFSCCYQSSLNIVIFPFLFLDYIQKRNNVLDFLLIKNYEFVPQLRLIFQTKRIQQVKQLQYKFPMKYSQLISKCIELIDTFNENIMTPDSHATQFLTNLKCQDTERVFLKQVFYGVQRYKGLLKASNNIIFQLNSTMTNRKNDTTLFSVFTYLICFRLDQLPFTEFKKIILSQDMIKMHVLLGFIFDFKTIEDRVLDVWSEHLERPYLQEKLLPKLQERRQKCEELIAKIQQLATGKKALDSSLNNTQQNIDDFGKDKKKSTVPKQFNLTKPKPKMLPQPIVIDVGFKANPVPKNSKDLKKIEDDNKKRRQDIKQNIKKYYEQKKADEFDFQTSKRPLNLPKIKQQVELMQTKQLAKKIVARPMPKYNEVDVKLNVAAILREEKKLNEKIQQEEQRMNNLEINMRDESEYETWKKQMKQKDDYEAMQQQQRRKIEMELAREAAIKAYEDNIQQKRYLVDDMKQIASELKDERQKLEQQVLQNKKNLVQEVQQSKQNIVVERQKVVEKNKKIRDEEVEERKRILEKKKEEEKIEMQKKKQLIQEIRELQKNIRAKPKQQIEYVSIGLLEELTLEQLRYRLDDVKRQRKQQQQRKRQQNNKKKQDFKSTISQKKDTIMAARQSLAKQKQQQRQKKKMQTQMEKQRLEDVKKKSLLEYKKKETQKQQDKKKEKEKLAKELKETQQRRMFLMQGQAAQQANAFKNLQKGQERQILDRQNTKLIEQYKQQSIKEGQRRILAEQNKKTVEKKIDFNKLYNQQEEFDNRMAEEVQQEDQASKAMKYHEVKTFEQKHTDNMNKTNPYKTKIAEMSLTNAKSFKKSVK